MRVADIVRGLVSGYGLKVIQVVATLLVVPFLLQDEILGLAVYGYIFAILGSLAPVSLITDGLRSSFSRTIARSLGEGPGATGREIGCAVKTISLVSLVTAAALFPAREWLLALLAIPVEADYVDGMGWAIAYVTSENLFYVTMSHLNARGRMDAANTAQGLEAVIRNLLFVAWFPVFGGSVTAYFGIFVSLSAAKSIFLVVYSIRKWPHDFAGFSKGRLRDAGEAVRYSFSISAASLNFFVFRRLSVPMTARFIGAEEAGLLALGLNTIANNLSQMLFNVAHPFLVPIASRIRFPDLSEARSRLLLNLDAIYSVTVGVVTIALIASMPTLVGIWLGAEHAALVFPAQILVVGSAFGAAFNLRRALLVGQGLAGRIARTSLIVGALGLVGLYWALVIDPDWANVAWVVASVTAIASIIGIGFEFDRAEFIPGTRRALGSLRVTAVLGIGVVAGFMLSRFAPDSVEPLALLPPLAAVATVLLASHFVLISMKHVAETLATLRSGANRQLFDETPSRGGIATADSHRED